MTRQNCFKLLAIEYSRLMAKETSALIEHTPMQRALFRAHQAAAGVFWICTEAPTPGPVFSLPRHKALLLALRGHRALPLLVDVRQYEVNTLSIASFLQDFESSKSPPNRIAWATRLPDGQW